MHIFSAKEARDEFSTVLDTARSEPVHISKNGKPVAVVISAEDYARFEALENNWWIERAKKAEKSGYIGVKATEKWMKALLNAKDKLD